MPHIVLEIIQVFGAISIIIILIKILTNILERKSEHTNDKYHNDKGGIVDANNVRCKVCNRGDNAKARS